jgi:hypothetical protein
MTILYRRGSHRPTLPRPDRPTAGCRPVQPSCACHTLFSVWMWSDFLRSHGNSTGSHQTLPESESPGISGGCLAEPNCRSQCRIRTFEMWWNSAVRFDWKSIGSFKMGLHDCSSEDLIWWISSNRSSLNEKVNSKFSTNEWPFGVSRPRIYTYICLRRCLLSKICLGTIIFVKNITSKLSRFLSVDLLVTRMS